MITHALALGGFPWLRPCTSQAVTQSPQWLQLASLGEGGVHDQTKLGFRLR